MRNMRNAIATGILALASHASAQVASVCRGDACFKLNIPESTASSGNGDIFFQISAPSSYEWVALGQGTRMTGSNMFLVYTSSGGSNVTLSPRTASGYSQPNFNGDAQVTLLEGSGISNGKMIANVKCSNCNSWSGGTADFKSNSGDFVYAYHSSGGPKNSDSTSASISQHDNQESFTWSWASAKGGSSVNPLLNAQPSGSGSTPGATSCIQRDAQSATSTAPTSTPTSDDDDDDSSSTQRGPPWATASPTGRPFGPPSTKRHDKRQNLPYCDDVSDGGFTAIRGGPPANFTKMLIAHGTLAALAFVILFPAGSIAIRLASFPGIVWFHAAFQVFAYIVYIAAFGLGVYLANGMNVLDRYHPIIGMVVFVCLFFQPIFGFLHHALFKKYGTRTLWSYAHLWLGRLVITLGIINGGLGFKFAGTTGMSSRGGMIAYSVIAGIIWLVWVASIIIGERKRAARNAATPPKYTDSPRTTETAERADIPHPENGHYAPK